MRITLQYWDECPNWRTALQRVRDALDELGLAPGKIELEQVTSDEQAQDRRFRGSPSILIDGDDPFAEAEAPYGLTCRVYRTEDGSLAGAPTVGQLVEAFRAHAA